jgi:hypothetical protein
VYNMIISIASVCAVVYTFSSCSELARVAATRLTLSDAVETVSFLAFLLVVT